jgi:DNA mismatch repair protein MutS
METSSDVIKKRLVNCEKQVYQQQVLEEYFKGGETQVLTSFNQYVIGTQAYCFLLDFIYRHNPNRTKKIKPPLFENATDRMVLANHSLRQLNIIDSEVGVHGNCRPGGRGRTKLSRQCTSVLSLLNQCITPMGKRKLQFHLLHPTTDGGELEAEYAHTAHLLEVGTYDAVRSKMSTLRDLEKLTRLLIMQRINAMDVGQLEGNLGCISDLFGDMLKDEKLSAFFIDSCGIGDDIHALCDTIRSLIGEVLDLDICKGFQHRSDIGDHYYIRRGYDSSFDALVENWMDSYDKLVGVQTWMNQLIKPFEKKGSDLVKIHATDKMGYQIQSTKRRISILNEQIKKLDKQVKITYFSKYHQSERSFIFSLSDMDYVNVSKSSSNQYIENPMIKKICHEIVHSKNIMLGSQSHIFSVLVKSLHQHTDSLEEIVKFIARLDFSMTKAYVAFKNNYHRPSILVNNSTQKGTKISKISKSQVSVKGLRHPLIEKLLQKESYVTNDVSLDGFNDGQKGILLYGTNAVGKSSFIKALGIAVIMAQAGFYVPAEHMALTPYLHIFTRILGNDNLFKGLSSFAVEMSEFKTILTMADDRSLILGDELCSGTESSSAISIFLAGIDHLYKKNSNFIFATHFHEITNLPEITDKKALSLKHMSVHYEVAKDKLVYDRKLRDGPGENMYGLEVCKALHLPAEFLEAAHELRIKYNNAGTGVLDYKPSRYNPQKLRGKCEMCHHVFSSEVHHKAQQKDAGVNGFIGPSLHKNHLSNLMSLCETCHHKIHNEKELEMSCGL